MPMALAIGNSSGPNSTMAGMPSRKLPSRMNATAEMIRKPSAPPGTVDITCAN
ncbi:hypothetical protein D3C84_1318090 [compost metagenome]